MMNLNDFRIWAQKTNLGRHIVPNPLTVPENPVQKCRQERRQQLLQNNYDNHIFHWNKTSGPPGVAQYL
jgi:hypothetical protein